MAEPPSPGGTGEHGAPAEPRALRRGRPSELSALDAGLERPARIQMAIATVLGIALVAIPLYLWRRPRSVNEAVGDSARPQASAEVANADAAAAPGGAAGAGAAAGVGAAAGGQGSGAATPGVALSDARVVECHDAGSKKTAPADCDHLPAVEKTIAAAIVQSASCVPASAGGGTIEYEADVSFLRKHNPIAITAPHDGRTVKGAHVAVACIKAIKAALGPPALSNVPHTHGRYKITIVATYP